MDIESDQYVVPLVHSDGTCIMSTVLATELVTGECELVLTWDEQRFESTTDNFFDAFCEIRMELWKLKLLPNCYGAHLQAFPSGMSRSMGRGERLYRLTMGKQAMTKDLVGLFDSGDDIIPATVEGQLQFYNHWLTSFGNKSES